MMRYRLLNCQLYIIRMLLVLVGCLAFSSFAQVPYDINTMSPQQALETGNLLRGQFKDKEARYYLKYAADKGNADAQYLYAISLLTYHTSDRNEPIAKDYLLASAKQGQLTAMHELYSNEHLLNRDDQQKWKSRYLELLMKNIDSHSPDSDFALYQFYKQEGNTEQAEVFYIHTLKAKYPAAMYEKAQRLLTGEDFYLFQSNRRKDANTWLIEAANAGYIPAFRLLISNYEHDNDYEQAYTWRVKLLQQGDLLSLASMGSILTGYSTKEYAQFIDKTLGLEYLGIYLKVAGTERMGSVYEKTKIRYEEELGRLSEAELKQHQVLLSDQLEHVHFLSFDKYAIKL
ncbi:sel1 repeat family protein [Vibrio algivorus]|uniref:Sel1 repeat family protein n=2 Tax=Vibrio algivorus TaxID=1667024 RepID=A0A557P5C3_9VIBR|nr:sel1 repeat family protein [Vibrio algivorus]TVO35865.1 sel1 repeat family protein [Vibrio algivorus]